MNPYIKDIQRLRDLLELEILDTQPEEYLNDLAKLTSTICNTPVSLISFIDDKRQWYKANDGFAGTEAPIEDTICQYTLVHDDVLEFEDTLQVELLKDNPYVKAENGVRFYAGINLYSENGNAVGTLCTVSNAPQKLNQSQKEALRIIAKQVMLHLNKEKANKVLKDELKVIVDQKVKKAKDKLKVQEQAYNNLYNAIEKSNAVIEFNPKGVVINVNDNFLDVFGFEREELIGQKNTILLDEEDKSNNKAFWNILQQGKYQSGKFKRVTKTGKVIWIQASYSPVLDHNGNLVKITKIAQDITLEVESQQNLKLAKQLAEDLSIQKDTFIANMSHELRTPLNAIVGFSELLYKNEIDNKKLKYLSAIKSASDSLLFLVNDILDLSKIESGIIQFDKNSFSLQYLIEEVFNILSLKAEQKNLEFTFFIDDSAPKYVVTDRNRLIQVLNNLLNNAIKFTEKGKVQLNVYAEKDKNGVVLKFSIKDTGIGISEDKLVTIFNRFTQAETYTSRIYGGTGLGLNISQLILNRQGGKIGVKSTPNVGSEFWFTLPVKEVNDVENIVEVDNTSTFESIHANILVCEDNELNRILLESIFKETNFNVQFAENGLKGIELVKKNNFDLILMDLQMPFLDGYDATKIIRNELKLEMPIIALTAHSLIREKQICLDLGMTDYLSKPFKRIELLSKIANLLKIENNVLFSLEGLDEYTGNNEEFKKQMIEVFITTSKVELENLKQFFNENNFNEAAKVVHKLKTSLGVLNVDLILAKSLEEILLEVKEKESINGIFDSFVMQIEKLNLELSNYLNQN